MEIKVNNLDFRYDSLKVVNNFSCIIKDNKISAIVGRSGSGKSTILNLIDGVLKPINGYIKFGSFKDKSYKRKVGYLFQSNHIFSNSVYMEIKSVLDFYGFSDVDGKIRDSIKMVGMDESFLYRSPSKLSSGELRRLSLACVFALDPDVLIMDDPFVYLDNKSRNELLRLFRTFKKDFGKTILIVSSDVDFILKFADYVFLIDNGSIYLEGNKYDVLSNEVAMSHCGLKVPDILRFSNLVLKNKGIKMGYRDEINDLIKDVYRYVK